MVTVPRLIYVTPCHVLITSALILKKYAQLDQTHAMTTSVILLLVNVVNLQTQILVMMEMYALKLMFVLMVNAKATIYLLVLQQTHVLRVPVTQLTVV